MQGILAQLLVAFVRPHNFFQASIIATLAVERPKRYFASE